MIAVIYSDAACAVEPDLTAREASQSVRKMVGRALPYLQRAGETWIEKRQCVSCHQVPFMLWSLSSAESNGFDVDSAKLRQWEKWSTKIESFVKPANKEDLDPDATMAANIDTMNGLLLGISRQDEAASSNHRDWRSQFTDALVDNQTEQGGWKACGQLPMQKRPQEETRQVTTTWTLLALERQGVTAKETSAAAKFIDNNAPESTEWWVARLLLAHERQSDDANGLRTKLRNLQHDDGGWGWLSEESSDALATGMTLYALAVTRPDVDSDRDMFAKAKQFLFTTQKQDGSWSVPGTKKTTRNKPTPTSNYWGTAWAVIGLLALEPS